MKDINMKKFFIVLIFIVLIFIVVNVVGYGVVDFECVVENSSYLK